MTTGSSADPTVTVVDAGPGCPAYRWVLPTSRELDDESREVCLLLVGHSGDHDWNEE